MNTSGSEHLVSQVTTHEQMVEIVQYASDIVVQSNWLKKKINPGLFFRSTCPLAIYHHSSMPVLLQLHHDNQQHING